MRDTKYKIMKNIYTVKCFQKVCGCEHPYRKQYQKSKYVMRFWNTIDDFMVSSYLSYLPEK